MILSEGIAKIYLAMNSLGTSSFINATPCALDVDDATTACTLMQCKGRIHKKSTKATVGVDLVAPVASLHTKAGGHKKIIQKLKQ